MKKFLLLGVVVFGFVLVQAYEVGGKAKSNFGASTTTQNAGAASSSQTRSFTNYGSRQNWSKGVETETVQTSLAGQQVTNFKPAQQGAAATVTAQPNTPAAPVAEKKEAAAPAAAGTAATATQASSQPAAGVGNMAGAMNQMAAAMQQMQGMQDMMKNMGALMGGAQTGGVNGKGGTPGAAGMPNIPGMPDMSSLLNAAGAGGQTPAKK